MPVIDFETATKQEEARLQKLHPTVDSLPGCMTMLDSFLSCNVLGVQLRSLYRFGQMSACGEKLEDFKFCMSLKSLDPDEKRDLWIRRRAEWWATRRLEKSSENVWNMRTEPLENWPPTSIKYMDTDGAETFS